MFNTLTAAIQSLFERTFAWFATFFSQYYVNLSQFKIDRLIFKASILSNFVFAKKKSHSSGCHRLVQIAGSGSLLGHAIITQDYALSHPNCDCLSDLSGNDNPKSRSDCISDKYYHFGPTRPCVDPLFIY